MRPTAAARRCRGVTRRAWYERPWSPPGKILLLYHGRTAQMRRIPPDRRPGAESRRRGTSDHWGYWSIPGRLIRPRIFAAFSRTLVAEEMKLSRRRRRPLALGRRPEVRATAG